MLGTFSIIWSISPKKSSPTNKIFALESLRIYATSGGANRQFIPTMTEFDFAQPITNS